jgi:hypothetical protein
MEQPNNIQPSTSNTQPQLVSYKLKLQVIETLRLKDNVDRKERRTLARTYKVKWEVYKKLHKEVQRRIKNNLDIETGEPNI